MPATAEAFLHCAACDARYQLGPMFHGCPSCRSELQVRYQADPACLTDASRPGIWRWRGLLPPVPAGRIASLHEGGTPLLPLHQWNGPATLFLKNETINPTWAYKDRAASVSATMARHFGYGRMVAISTGNLGNSVAAYAARAGLGCTIFCNAGAPDLQVALMRHYGAEVFRGGDQEALVRQLVDRGGWFPATVISPRAGYGNPYGIEGFKTIAFEIFEQLGNRVPDRIFAPVGSGDGMYGIWKGFDELHRLGIAASRPKMIACQAEGADVYVKAFREGAKQLKKLPSVSTVALSIAEEIGGQLTLDAIYESGGAAVSLSDEAILAEARSLGREGVALEPASSASVAGARMIAKEAEPGEVWVAIGTGSAVKWPGTITRDFQMPVALSPTFRDAGALIPV